MWRIMTHSHPLTPSQQYVRLGCTVTLTDVAIRKGCCISVWWFRPDWPRLHERFTQVQQGSGKQEWPVPC